MKDKNNAELKIYELFGISEERADEIVKAFRHAKIDSDIWSEALKKTMREAKITTVGDGLYLGWVFAKMYDNANSKVADLLTHLMEH